MVESTVDNFTNQPNIIA